MTIKQEAEKLIDNFGSSELAVLIINLLIAELAPHKKKYTQLMSEKYALEVEERLTELQRLKEELEKSDYVPF